LDKLKHSLITIQTNYVNLGKEFSECFIEK